MGGIDMVRQIAPKTQLGLIKSNVNQGGETIAPEIVYPESDGKPMADNTKQFTWIVKIKENLEVLFKSNPDVFVAGDLFWCLADRKDNGAPIDSGKRIIFLPRWFLKFYLPVTVKVR
jgi:hypothetical protein